MNGPGVTGHQSGFGGRGKPAREHEGCDRERDGPPARKPCQYERGAHPRRRSSLQPGPGDCRERNQDGHAVGHDSLLDASVNVRGKVPTDCRRARGDRLS